jgi:hypothetical protein
VCGGGCTRTRWRFWLGNGGVEVEGLLLCGAAPVHAAAGVFCAPTMPDASASTCPRT